MSGGSCMGGIKDFKYNGRINEIFVGSKEVIKKAIVHEENRQFRLKRESWALAVARSKGVNVPAVVSYYIDDNNQEVLITQRINGIELSSECTPADQNSFFNVGVQMHKLLLPSQGFGWPHPRTMEGEFPDWSSFLCHFSSTYGMRMIKTGIIPVALVANILNLIKKINPKVIAPFLVHRDIKPRNILYTPDHRVWIIDWENAILGDYLFDVASYGARYGHDLLWHRLAEGYDAGVESSKYNLYEAVLLVGLIDFLRKHGLSFDQQQRRLIAIVKGIL